MLGEPNYETNTNLVGFCCDWLFSNWYNNLKNKFENILPRGTYQRTKETLERMRQAQLGKKHSEETKEKISKSNIGRIGGMYGKHHSEEARQRISLGTMRTQIDEKAGSWKGDKVGDKALHNWVRRRLPKPEKGSSFRIYPK